MESLHLPNDILGWLGLVFMFIIAITNFKLTRDKTIKERTKEVDSLDQKLISGLKETVGQLEKKVQLLEDQHSKNAELITQLSASNQTMRDILQGRDKDSLEFQRQGLETMKLFGEVSKLVMATNVTVTQTHDEVKKLYQMIESHMNHIRSIIDTN